MLKIGFIVFPRFQLISFGAVSVFELANLVAERTVYDIHILSEAGGPVRSSVGIAVETQPFRDASFDTVIVGAGTEVETPTPGLLSFVRDALTPARRVAAICTGAFVLAEAGMLDGRRATTHWGFARELRARFPKTRVEEDRIFVIDGQVWTSAGMTAGIDLALAMVDNDLGADLARLVAKKLVVYHRRAGGQSQFSALLDLDPKSGCIQAALAYAKRNLRTSLSVEKLAKVANLSPRQFSRAFRAQTGQSPAKAVENLRVESARLMLEHSQHPLDAVAIENGFGDRDRMRRAFLRAFGQPPQVMRRNGRG